MAENSQSAMLVMKKEVIEHPPTELWPYDGIKLEDDEVARLIKGKITYSDDACRLAAHYLLYKHDVTNGLKYYEIAANLGSAGAAYNLGQYFAYYPEIRDVRKAEYWFKVAIKLGNTNAAERISELYRFP